MPRHTKKLSPAGHVAAALPIPKPTEQELNEQRRHLASLIRDDMEADKMTSPFGFPYFERTPAELFLLGLIAANFRTEIDDPNERFRSMQKRLQKALEAIFDEPKYRDNDLQIIQEIVFEFRCRELEKEIGKINSLRGAGSVSWRNVTKEILLRHDRSLQDGDEILERRIESLRKKAAHQYRIVLKSIESHSSWCEGETFVTLMNVQKMLSAIGIKMNLKALAGTE